MSQNVLLAFARAARQARRRSEDDAVTARDILYGLLRADESQATAVLESFQIDPRRLLARLEMPGRNPLAAWPFDPQMKKVTDEAVRAAGELGGQVSTAHLLLGLLRAEGGWTTGFLETNGVKARKLTSALEWLANPHPEARRPGTSPEMAPSPNSSALLDRAGARARTKSRDAIGEIDLLAVILDGPSGSAREILKACGVRPAELLTAVNAVG